MITRSHAMLSRLLLSSTFFFMFTLLHAGAALWTIIPNPDFPPAVSLTRTSIQTIKYTITNNSRRTKILAMKSIAGINQVTTLGNCSNPFTLTYQQSCTLTLQVNGIAKSL